MIKTEVVRITPAIAEEWLRHRNITNRSLSRRHIAMMVDDMREGRWEVTGEALIFDANGRLTNGHHRLTACMKAGVPFTSLVVRGVEPSAVFVQDTGRARTAANMAAIMEIPQGKFSTAAARILLCYEGGDFITTYTGGVGGPTKTQIIEDCESRPRFSESVLAGRKCSEVLFAAVASACHWLFSQKDRFLAEEFFRKVQSGASMEAGDPVLKLRQRVQSKNKLKTTEMLALTIKAWNLTRAGKPLNRRLEWRPSTAPSEAFPVVN
jgi:hypothetical protein